MGSQYENPSFEPSVDPLKPLGEPSGDPSWGYNSQTLASTRALQCRTHSAGYIVKLDCLAFSYWALWGLLLGNLKTLVDMSAAQPTRPTQLNKLQPTRPDKLQALASSRVWPIFLWRCRCTCPELMFWKANSPFSQTSLTSRISAFNLGPNPSAPSPPAWLSQAPPSDGLSQEALLPEATLVVQTLLHEQVEP